MTRDELVTDARKWAADPMLVPHERAMWELRARDLIDEQRAIECREDARREDAEFVGASNGSVNWEDC